MSVLTRWMSLGVLKYAAFVLFTLVSLSLTFELMERADNVLRATQGNEAAVLRYAWLRLPELVGRLAPIAVLVGALLSFGMMTRYDELIAMWGSGVSVWGMLRALTPLAAALGALLFVLNDRVTPQALDSLQAWGVVDLRKQGGMTATEDATWLRSGADVIRIPRESAKMGRLRAITIFQRDEAGMLVAQIDADRADPSPDGWQLSGVTRVTVDPTQREALPGLLWTGQIEVSHLEVLSRDLPELSLGQLVRLIREQGYGQRPTELFQTWLQARLSSALTPMIMIFLVVVLAQRFRRTGDFGPLLLQGLAFGFAFFVFDGMTLSMGEAGLLPPWAAAWSAEAMALLLIFALAFKSEG